MNKLNFSTAYHQFYVCDSGSELDTGGPSFWTDEAFNSKMAIGDGVIGVGTVSYGSVSGEIGVLNGKPPSANFAGFDHVVEGSLDLRSGCLQVRSCPGMDIELEIAVKPATYRVRVYGKNFDSIPDGEEDGDDYYIIELWQEAASNRVVLLAAEAQ